MIPPPFPTEPPFRIDQVVAAPLLMTGLFVAQGLLAILIHVAGAQGRRQLWRGGVIALLLLVFVFFTLASWGNTDTTRFSHFMEWDLSQAPPEPLWKLVRPLVLLLPYRMAAVQGLVATGYAAAVVLLASSWRAQAWAGWWSLLILGSPLLRGFLQNAHTRQALAVLLLLPLFLQTARLVRVDRRLLGLGVVLSALTHNTFVLNLPFSLLPALQRLPSATPWLLQRARTMKLADWRRRWPWLLLGSGVLMLFLLVAPIALDRFIDYSQEDYFNSYPLRSIVGRLQRAMALGLVLGCLQAQLDPRRLLRCRITQLLLLFGLLYLGIQASISHLWLPQITSRLADGVAFLLLILYLAWLHTYRVYWCVLPALYVTLQYWLEGRLLPSGSFPCGENDEFLCIPDRWPWQVHY
jgi:hypothetical protein